MRGKKAKVLRTIAERSTLGVPKVQYNDMSAILIPKEEDGTIRYYYTRRHLERCTRSFYQGLKKHFPKGVGPEYEDFNRIRTKSTEAAAQNVRRHRGISDGASNSVRDS